MVFLEPEFISGETPEKFIAITLEIFGYDLEATRHVLIDSKKEVNIELALRNHISKVIDDHSDVLKKYWVEIE